MTSIVFTHNRAVYYKLLILAMLCYSCAENSNSSQQQQIITEQEAETSKTSGSFYAVCDEKLPLGSHGPLGWCGPKRTLHSEVKKDTADHHLTYPGHKSSICSGVCPTCE